MALISHKYKFVFVKTTKTAGTAIEVSLSKLMDQNDIVTPIYPSEPGHHARNYDTPKGKFYNHMPAKEIRHLLGKETFNNYFKFCVERAPLDKCLSHYAMLKYSPYHNKNNSHLNWAKYVEHGNFPIDLSKYTDEHGNLLVDHVINYETLTEELFKLLTMRNVPFSKLTSKAKSGFREKKPREENVTINERKAIYLAFHKTITFLKTNSKIKDNFVKWPAFHISKSGSV